MKLKSHVPPKQAYMSLHVKGSTSIYQWDNERQLDSIRAIRELTDEDFNRYYSSERYAIEIEKNKLIYYDNMIDVEYQYREELNFDWQLKPQTKTIKGYHCKKATVSYGGRDWIAWYTMDVPIDAGPYKFKGLPGLIIKMTDSTNSYDFEIFSLEKKDSLPLKKGYHHSKEKDRVTTNRTDYNKIRFKINSLNFNERMELLSKKTGEMGSFTITSSEGENPFSDNRNTFSAKNNNFIEIDHD
jgi:GLPGLI family protein